MILLSISILYIYVFTITTTKKVTIGIINGSQEKRIRSSIGFNRGETGHMLSNDGVCVYIGSFSPFSVVEVNRCRHFKKVLSLSDPITSSREDSRWRLGGRPSRH